MGYLTNNTQARLQNAFEANGLILRLGENYVTVHNSQQCTEDKIKKIVEEAGFTPIISANKIGDNFVFTILPYLVHPFFSAKLKTEADQSLAQTSTNLSPMHVLSQDVERFYNNRNTLIKNAPFSGDRLGHCKHNAQNIRSLAEGLRGEALILGLGNAHDTPLAELAEQFDQVTVMDIDIETVIRVIKTLPENLQKKVVPVQKDLTGLLPLLSEKLGKELNVSEEECVDKVTDIMSECLKVVRQLTTSSAKKYNFVISSALTAELFLQIHDYVMSVIKKKYPDIEKQFISFKDDDAAAKKNNDIMDELFRAVCLRHLDDLSEWTSPQGRIYYADSSHQEKTGVRMNSDGELELTVVHSNDVLPNMQIADRIEQTFRAVKTQDQWRWSRVNPRIAQEPQLHCLELGTAMKFVAHFLQPIAKATDSVAGLLAEQVLSQDVEEFYRNSNLALRNLPSNKESVFNDHCQRNRNNILSSAQGLRGEALILGLGNGFDTPLSELACQFNRVTVIDIDIDTVTEVVQKLPTNLRKKVISIQMDLTGLLPLLSEKLGKELNVSEKECFDKVADIISECLKTVSRETISAVNKYDFVISSMLTSELSLWIYHYVISVVRKKYPDIEKQFESSNGMNAAVIKDKYPKLRNALGELFNTVCISHLDNLSKWTSSEGRVYYADRFYQELMDVKVIANGQLQTTRVKSVDILPNEEIKEKIGQIFRYVKNSDHWLWHTAEAQTASEPNPQSVNPRKTMRVAAHFLQPIAKATRSVAVVKPERKEEAQGAEAR